jgi:tetratricopeptide (TPR) repeat protein
MLDDDRFQTLSVLGFLFRRLGLNAKALRLYRALALLRPEDPATLASGAAAAIDEGEAQEALSLLDRLADLEKPGSFLGSSLLGGEITAGSPILWLLRAKALWALKREPEAQVAVNNYLKSLAKETEAK